MNAPPPAAAPAPGAEAHLQGAGDPALRGGDRGHLRGDRALLLLVVAAVCWRWLLARLTPVPAEDGVNYLWMAQQFAVGHEADALSEPFSPLWSLLLAVPIACGVEPMLAGQLLGCVCGGLLALPV